MALPSSGPLSIADIRNEGVAGGCYPAGDPYSLGLLATAFGIPTDPDSISEFYGRSCPTSTTTSTTTTTTTPPPTTTSTTTTTTTPPPTTTTTTTSTTTTTTTPPPTTTTTTTSTTTTTTTAVVPITFTATPSCVDGVGQIAVTSYAGGNGNYQWIAISGISRNDAAFQVASGTRFAAGSSFTFSSLANGNYWVALRDTANNTGITNDPGININCIPTTTTTTSTTTTTTTPPPTTTTTTTSTTTTTTTPPPTTTTTTTSTTTTTTTTTADCTFTGGSATQNCSFTISQVQTTNPTNQQGNNGTATITFTNATAPVTYTLNGVSGGTATSPLTINNLSANTNYTVILTDANSCTAQDTFQIGDTLFIFDADYIMVTYEFTNGKDLDTRTRIVTPNVGQVTANDYVGYGKPRPGYVDDVSIWPRNAANPYEVWGGDNKGTGFESVLINLNIFTAAYPSATSIVVDLRAFWFVTVGTNPVNVAAVLWKGGTPVKNGCFNATVNKYFCWTNPTATSTLTINSVPKVITSRDITSGERVATLTYNLVTGEGILNNNDTTTPSV
jgi:hypothetical protein